MSPPTFMSMSLVGLVLCAAVFAVQSGEPPLVRPKHPKVADRDWPRIPLDHFVLARFEAKGQKPPAEANKTTCFKRAHYDLTGLYPTSEELASLEADKSLNAYEKAIERLLVSQQCATAMALHWQKLVHTADLDYVAWVEKAWKDDMPYDRFIAEQAKRFPRIRDRTLGAAGIDLDEDESVPHAIDRHKVKLARTFADRCWKMLMKTDAATDPELLDWLACELMQSTQISCCRLEEPMPQPWEMKPFVRTIVISAAYRARSD